MIIIITIIITTITRALKARLLCKLLLFGCNAVVYLGRGFSI